MCLIGDLHHEHHLPDLIRALVARLFVHDGHEILTLDHLIVGKLREPHAQDREARVGAHVIGQPDLSDDRLAKLPPGGQRRISECGVQEFVAIEDGEHASRGRAVATIHTVFLDHRHATV